MSIGWVKEYPMPGKSAITSRRRSVSQAFLHRHFEFLDEQALAADFGERAIQNLVALGGHAENDNFGPGI